MPIVCADSIVRLPGTQARLLKTTGRLLFLYPRSDQSCLIPIPLAITSHTHSTLSFNTNMSPATSAQTVGAVVPPGDAVEICTVSNTNAIVPPGGAVEICTVSNNDAVVPPGGAVEICTVSKVVPPGGAVEICTIA